MKEIGKWMNKNNKAIYNTRITKNYHEGNIWFTQNPKEGSRYALVCLKDNEPLTKEITWHDNLPRKGTKIKLLETGETIKWKQDGNAVILTLPASLIKSQKNNPAMAFSFIPAGEN